MSTSDVTLYDFNTHLGSSALRGFLEESNKIEGIDNERIPDERWARMFAAATEFLLNDVIEIKDLQKFVKTFQPNAVIRDHPLLNVQVGDHVAPRGGDQIVRNLTELVDKARHNAEIPYQVHLCYENLHPFTDCNGRSGRMLYLWQCLRYDLSAVRDMRFIGFLHHWYYQSLR